MEGNEARGAGWTLPTRPARRGPETRGAQSRLRPGTFVTGRVSISGEEHCKLIPENADTKSGTGLWVIREPSGEETETRRLRGARGEGQEESMRARGGPVRSGPPASGR